MIKLRIRIKKVVNNQNTIAYALIINKKLFDYFKTIADCKDLINDLKLTYDCDIINL